MTAFSFLPEESTEVLQQRLIGALKVQGDYRKRIRRARVAVAYETAMLVVVTLGAIGTWALFALGMATYAILGDWDREVPGYFVVAIAFILALHVMEISPKSQNRDRKKARDRLAGTKAFLATGESVIDTLRRQIVQRGAASGE